MIAHSGEPYPAYIGALCSGNTLPCPAQGSPGGLVGTTDLNGDGVSNQGHSNDRPTVQLGSGSPFLLGRYPFSQPNFFNWDARLTKDFAFKERYHAQLLADFFNLTNRGNLYSNPESFGNVTLTGCHAGPGMSTICNPLTAIPRPSKTSSSPFFGYGTINQIAPLATPFSFQAGFKFIF
jgi:hypothetical protein